MNEERQEQLRGHIGRGMLLSFFIHGSFIFPFIALAIVFARREAENRDLDVSFEQVSPAELPDNLPPLEPEPTPQAPAPKTKQQLAQLPPDVPVPPEKEQPPEKVEQPPPPKPQQEKQHEKMVDLDNNQEVEPPPDAKYLAQKNNRAKEETRAKDTNLQKEMKGDTAASAKSDRKEEEPGEAERKIARDEEQKSKRGRSAPPVTPHLDPRVSQPSPSPSKSLLSMRDAPKRNHEITPETVDPSLPRDPDGLRQFLEDRPEAVKDLGGAPGANSSRLALSGKQYEYIFGDDADAARRLAEKQRSKRPGKFSERLGRIQSALENFIPEVRPGNQTALNTRAAPFAAFIARMHRNIHELWGFGFLEDLDRQPMSNPLNNPSLITKLEIVLNGDGTIAKVTIIKASGIVQYDVAAIDAVYSAGPYADPPREIRSANGKIYIHWTFHRDERQCATSGVDYYILDNPPPGSDKGEAETSRGLMAPVPSAKLKRLEREGPRNDGDPAHAAKRRQLETAVNDAEEPDHDANRRAAQQVVRADDPAAREVAAAWFDAYAKGDLRRMVGQSALPFRSSSGVAAKNAGELRHLLSALLEESEGTRTVRSMQLYSPAGARGALGSLPPGFDEGGPALFAIAHVSGDTFVLVLGQKAGVWRPIGLVRR
jgi:outer membrane biosynthesis protein TonB